MVDASIQQSINVADLFSVKGKIALVTGGSRGIGLMIARAYAVNGVKVYISSRKKEACNNAAAELSKIGECVSIPADLSTSEGRAALVSEIKRREHKLHILVNNAGASWGATIEAYPEEAWDKVMTINVKSIFMLTRDLLDVLARAGTAEDPARVINVGSIDGIKVPALDNFAYSPSKAAVHHLTRVLAVRIASHNMTVNAVAPGPFESKMTEWMLKNFRETVEQICPRKRIGRPSDMAGVALFLASPAGAFINGAVIPVDGGLSLT
ncbi:MAG: SDR family oxidoreductase [Deltaproteobacteria bacterium]|nr:SDR family oxidoreductase [Deltaproteobacteria bacterium]